MSFCPACRSEYPPEVETCRDCELPTVDSLEETAGEPDVGKPPLPPGLVTIASFDNPAEAAILGSRLEAAGIESFIADAEIINAHGLYAGIVGGVKVQVRREDGPRAQPLAEEAYAARRKAIPPCPNCTSTSVERGGLPLLLSILVVLSLGVMSLFLRTRWVCQDCKHRWA